MNEGRKESEGISGQRTQRVPRLVVRGDGVFEGLRGESGRARWGRGRG